MITNVTLSPAQAAVLSGPVEWNADGSTAVTTGRENTLASLRRAGFLAGNLLTANGRNARHTVEGGSRKVTASENGAAVSYVKSVTENDVTTTTYTKVAPQDVRADWETAPLPAPVARTMCQDCQTRPATIFDTDAPMCAECAGDVPVKLSRPMQTTGDSIPWGAEHVYSYSGDWTVGLSHGSFNLYRLDETEVYGPELSDGVKWFGVQSFSGSTPTTFYVGYSLADAMRALAVAHGGHARYVDRMTQTAPGVRVSKIVPGAVVINFLGRYAESLPALPSMTDSQTHGITFVGDDSTMCGTLVRGEGVTLRVSVDPSDVTCAQCIAREVELAALDAVQPEDDDADHREAIKAAREAETAALTAAEDPWAETDVPAEDGPLLLMVQPLTGAPNSPILASVGEHLKEFRNGPAWKLHVAFWAHSVGFRPERGRGFKWQQSGVIQSARAAMI